MMAPKGPPAKGAGGPIPGADALWTVEETPVATAGGTRPPPITAGLTPRGYQGARRSHPLLLMSVASSSMERGIQRRQAAPGYWEKQTSTVYNSDCLSS